MISNDKNIERIADFVEEAKEWFTLRKEYTKLDIIDKVVRICTVLTLTFVFAILILLILTYFSFAAAYFIADLIESTPLAFCCVSLFYIFMLFVIYKNKSSWIERPMVKFLVSIMLEENKQ